MNQKQKIAMWLGISCIVLMGLFPPWTIQFSTSEIFQGYSFFTSSPKLTTDGDKNTDSKVKAALARKGGGVFIDYKRLVLQCGLVIIVAGGLIVTLNKSKL